VLRAERAQELIEVELESAGGKVRVQDLRYFGGPMAYMLSWTGVKDDIVKRFGRQTVESEVLRGLVVFYS
jgi:hypothetical protein